MSDWLLHRLLDDESREAILGDLHEGYAALRVERGGAYAAWWYYSHAFRSVLTCRITGHRSVAARRLDDEHGARPTLRDLLRPALRQFRDHPLYAATSAGTLALAVAAACVSFAVAKRAFLDPLPYRADAEIVTVLTSVDGMVNAVSPHVAQDLRASTGSPLVAFAPIRPQASAYATADSTETIGVSFVEADYFGFLGVPPASGRVWTNREPDAIVLSAAFWLDRLDRAPDVIGRSVVVDGRARTVVGVMPEDFRPPYFNATDAWMPLDMPALLADLRARRTLTVLARRAAHVPQSELDAYMAVFSRQLRERHPEHAGQHWVARPLRDELVGSARPALLGVAGAAALLLLIVAANIAGLSAAHAVQIRQQLAVRAALGASRARLFADHFINSVVLAFIGAAAGIWMAFGLMRVVARYQQSFLAGLAPIALDLTTAAIGLLAGMAVGVGAALLPRSVVTPAPHDALRTARGGSADVKVTLTRSMLVVAQVAMALVLIVGAGLLVRTVQHLSQRDLGFTRDGLAWIQVTLPGQRYQAHDAQLQFEREVVERVGQVPGVASVTASVGYPLWGGMMAGLALKTDPPGTPRREVAYLSVSPNFTRDVGARIVAGRDLLATDDFNATRAVVINETMARMFWPKGDAIGSEVQIGAGAPTDRWITVVGIMADMRAHGLTSAILPTAFGSTLQYSWPRRHIGVRLAGAPPATLAADVKRAIHAVDPAVAIGALTLAEQNLNAAMARHRLVTIALAVFGTVALVLCVSGLYAVVTLNSQQRRREYAIRVALGARRGTVGWMVLRQALALGGLGTVAGLIGALVGTRALQGLLHGVEAIDVATFSASGLLLIVLAALASWHPARSAACTNPVETLRAE